MLLPSRIRVPPIPGQSRVASYRLRIARLCSLALCDRRSLKTLINRFQLHYLPDGALGNEPGAHRADEIRARHPEHHRALPVPLGFDAKDLIYVCSYPLGA